MELFRGSRFLDAFITSYSGEYWTDGLTVDGTTVYDLSQYSDAYASLGDPYHIRIPVETLSDGNVTFNLTIATDSFNASEICSQNNTVVYTIAVNLSTERSDALPLAEGCSWQIELESGGYLNLSIPKTYGGNNSCSYTKTNITYNPNDAYQTGAFTIFNRLDFKKDGTLFVNLNEEDLEIIVSTITGVPYMWGPADVRIEVER